MADVAEEVPSSGGSTLLRAAGAFLAAGMALGAMALLYLAAEVPPIESLLHVRLVLSPAGPLTGLETEPEGAARLLLAWSVGPAGALVGGWLLARRAVAGERWAGAWMGLLTYIVAIVLAPLAIFVLPPIMAGSSLTEMAGLDLVGAAMFGVLGGLLLVPLLAVCVAAGMAWAGILRRTTIGLLGMSAPEASGTPLSGAMLVVILVVMGLLWLLVAGPLLFGGLVGGEFVD